MVMIAVLIGVIIGIMVTVVGEDVMMGIIAGAAVVALSGIIERVIAGQSA